MLHVNQLTYGYPESSQQIFDHLSFSIQKGEFVSLIGASGSGKSTILKIIAGLMEPEEGTLQLDGRLENRIGRVAYMPQNDLLLPWRTVLQNVMLPVELTKKDWTTEQEKALGWLKEFGLEQVTEEYPSRLSGGMKQRVAFLRTIMTGSDLLLLDEPFGALDALRKQEMQVWLLSIWERLGKTILFITHDIEEAVLLSDRVLILRDGKVEEVDISLPRPRKRKMIFDSSLIEYRMLLSEKLRKGE